MAFETSYQLARRITGAGMAVSGVLAASNIYVGSTAGSTSVVATGVEFAGDVLASAIVLIGMRVASRPADENHPYGHGRFETLSAFLVGLILTMGGAGISYQSLQLVGERHAPPGLMAVVALAAAIVLRGTMSVIKFRVGRRLRSSALVADAWNDAVDIVSAAVALLAVGLATWNPERFLAADHYGGAIVGLVVVVMGLRVVRDASYELADTMPPPEMTSDLQDVALAIDGVRGIDKVLARKTGLQYHIDLHLEVDPEMTVDAAHQLAGLVRSTLRQRLPWIADVLIHIEPAHTPR